LAHLAYFCVVKPIEYNKLFNIKNNLALNVANLKTSYNVNTVTRVIVRKKYYLKIVLFIHTLRL